MACRIEDSDRPTMAPTVVRIPILPLKVSNAYALLSDKGTVLIDSGLPGSTPKIEAALSRHGRSLRDIKAIVITHAHVDHAGNAAELRERTGAPIIAHEDDLPYYKRDRPMSFCPTGLVGRLFFRTPLPHRSYSAFVPDVLLTEAQDFDLSTFGVLGAIRHTPGHTKGSISVELASKQALVGDLAASGVGIGGIFRTKHAIRPPFEDDPQAVGRELLRLLNSGAERFHVGHGGELNAKEVRRHAQALLRKEQCTTQLIRTT